MLQNGDDCAPAAPGTPTNRHRPLKENPSAQYEMFSRYRGDDLDSQNMFSCKFTRILVNSLESELKLPE